jgi:acetoin utilization deacetylase AcuC-like enzyme
VPTARSPRVRRHGCRLLLREQRGGRGAGAGFNLNLPLPAGTKDAGWLDAVGALGLQTLLVQGGGYAVDALGTNLLALLDGFRGARR